MVHFKTSALFPLSNFLFSSNYLKLLSNDVEIFFFKWTLCNLFICGLSSGYLVVHFKTSALFPLSNFLFSSNYLKLLSNDVENFFFLMDVV